MFDPALCAVKGSITLDQNLKRSKETCRQTGRPAMLTAIVSTENPSFHLSGRQQEGKIILETDTIMTMSVDIHVKTTLTAKWREKKESKNYRVFVR